jgi:hypothetical protein
MQRRQSTGLVKCPESSTPTRFRHIFLMQQKLGKNEAAKGGIKISSSGFVHNSLRHDDNRKNGPCGAPGATMTLRFFCQALP